jgi:AcrR family transcriptional regulator
MAQSGRRPGTSNTSEQILAAARTLFAVRGFQGTTVRAIATEAGVNPAMISHFFGSKDELFVAALAFPFNPVERIGAVINTTPRAELGPALVRMFVGIWRDAHLGPSLRAALREGAASESGAEVLRTFAAQFMLPRMSTLLALPEDVVAAALSQLLGYAMVAMVIEIEPLASAEVERVVELLGPAVQTYLDRDEISEP